MNYSRRKIILSIILAAGLFPAAAQLSDGRFAESVPAPFGGIWERDDRFVMFAGGEEDERNYVSILLKTFYAWYLDRTAEGPSFAQSQKRIINDSTSPKAEYISAEYRPLVGQSSYGQTDGSVWEIFIRYPGIKEDVVIPVAVIGDALYLDFAVKLSDNPAGAGADENDALLGFWCRMSEGDGVKACIPNTAENIYSTYIMENAVYTIRYWRTDMAYSNEKAFFSDGGQTFSVVKHIQSAGKIYTCCNGRSVTIRNVQKSSGRPKVYRLDKSGSICGLGTPYLKRVQDVNTKEAVFALFDKAYAQRAPNPDPPFPPSDLDWHMDEIRALEAGNKIIQAVRERQKEFAGSALRQQ